MRFTDRLQALAAGKIVSPVHVRIKPINRCNHRCWYCAYRSDTLTLGEDMDLDDRIPPDKMFEIVDDLIAMNVKAVTFSGGGEPLLYKPLPEVVRRLTAGGVRVATLTNGSNLRGAMADAFAEHGTWVRISLDAWNDESYASARGVAIGAFSALLDTIRAFTARRSRCVLGVSFIVGTENHTHIAETCALLRDVGVHHVKISGAVISNNVTENNIYHRKLAEIVADQIIAAQKFQNDHFSIINHYHELSERFDKEYLQCHFMQFLTVIGADSQIYACQDKAYTHTGLLGSIAGQRFRDFWFSDEHRGARRALNPSENCQHHCVAHQKNLVLNELLSTDAEHACFV